jgi:hypothetical protein
MQYLEFLLARHDTGAALPNGKITVKLAGTSTLATVYDSSGGTITQPVSADINGVIGFAAANGAYDLYPTSADGAYIAPTIHKVQLYDLTGLDSQVTAAGAGATLAGHFANDNTNTAVPGQGDSAARGAKWWSDQAAVNSNGGTLGIVLPYLPGPMALFADFTHNAYYNAGAASLSMVTWLTSAGGSFTRGGTSHPYWNAAGQLKQGTANVARFSYDPITGVGPFLLNEPASANGFNWTRTPYDASGTSWNFVLTGFTTANNAVTGLDGTTSAGTLMETATTSTHRSYYYPGGIGTITSGHYYVYQFYFGMLGRTKLKLSPGGAISGFAPFTVDTGTLTSSNPSWIIEALHSGIGYRVRRTFQATATGIVSMDHNLLDASGNDTYLGDITKGLVLLGMALDEVASLTSPVPSLTETTTATQVTRSADAAQLTIPAGVSQATFVLASGARQLVSVSPGSYTFPTTLNESGIDTFASVDLSVVGAAVLTVAGRTGNVTIAQADVAGLLTTSNVTHKSLITTDKLNTFGASILQQDGPISVWSATTATGYTSANRGVIIGRTQAKPATFSNSSAIGPDSAGAATTLATSVVIGDSAGGGCVSISGCVFVGNEAGNTGAASLGGVNAIGNTINLGGNSGTAASNRVDVMGQSALRFNSATDTVVMGNGAATGVGGTPGQVNQSVILGSGAGANLGNGNTTTGNIIIGYGIAAPSASTNNYLNIGGVLKGSMSTGAFSLTTAAAGAASLAVASILPGAGTAIWTSGSGTPEGAVTAPVGSLFTRTNGGAGTTLYVKESGSGNTGWIGK